MGERRSANELGTGLRKQADANHCTPLEANIRLLLVDDRPLFLELEATFFIAHPRIVIVGRASSGIEAVDQTARLYPDLVLMDLSMPGMNGLEATSRIKKQPNPPRIIILTMHDLPAYRDISRVAGADGFVTKADFGLPLLRMIDELFPFPQTGAQPKRATGF
jgi:DNA-binding NarL/FixJ family response regulator